MALSRDSLNERKLKYWRRMQFRAKQAFERFEWEEQVLLPEIEAMKANKSILGLPDGMAFDIVIEDATPDPPKADDASE